MRSRNLSRARRPASLAVLTALAALAVVVGSAPAALATMRGAPPFAGYLVGQLSSSQAHKVAADFTVPALSCPSSGIYGVEPTVATGTAGVMKESAFVVAECSSGTASYEATIMLGGTHAEFPVRPGDNMAASVSYTPTSGGAFTVAIKDLTHSAAAAQHCASMCGGFVEAFFGDQMLCTKTARGCVFQPVAPFTGNKFTGAVVDGAALGSAKPTSVSLRDPDNGKLAIVPSAISKGKNFQDIFKNS